MGPVVQFDVSNPGMHDALWSHEDAASISKPKVSVCMPSHRNSEWFQQALRSALSQSMADFEIVITDDSGGGLQEVARSFSDPRIRYYPNPKRLGFAGNHCRAIDLTTGEYVAFLHDDDQWEVDYLAKAVEVLDQQLDVGVVLCGAMEVDENDNAMGMRPARMEPGNQTDPMISFLGSGFMMMLPSLSVFRRTALDSNPRPWPDVIAADSTMFVDVVMANWKIHYVAQPLVRYRIHSQQIGTDDLAHRHALVTVWKSYKFEEERLEFLRKQILAQSLVARAGAFVKRNRFMDARRDLSEAKQVNSKVVNARWWILRLITAAPFVMPLLLKAKNLLPRKDRHSGF
jgi:glycosyltransferase involved in cell wall biosynthesis